MGYQEFLQSKQIIQPASGFRAESLSPILFEFQRDITRWSIERGRAAVFADCGLGKTPMQLQWAESVTSKFNRPVLILAPLAVSKQTQREGEKFGIPVTVAASDMDIRKPGVYVTNYEKLQHFDPSRFSGVVLDESSILKSFTGATRNMLIERFRDTPMKLAATATPAPNDFMELGNHSEFFGVLTRTEMLSTFFVHDGGDTAKWRLKGHAEEEYWKWVCGWAVMIRKPSDLGYSDAGFDLPPLNLHQITVKCGKPPDGFLFQVEARTREERLAARRASIPERVKACAELVLKYGPCGNPSTQKIENAKSNQTRNTEPGEGLSDRGLQNRTNDTCKTGTSGIRRKSKPTTKSQRTEQDGDNGREIGTPTIPSIGKNGKRTSRNTALENPTQNDLRTCGNSDSPLPITNECLNRKTADAQSAARQTVVDTATSTSITATQPESSGGYSANGAILVSDNSPTTLNGWNEQRHTSDDQWVIWCGLNDEQDAIARLCGNQCVSIYGSLSDFEKESRLDQWLRGDKRILISKPSIFGFGLNFQQCSNVVFLGLSDSYESFYQSVRRCWRFGQKRTVNCYIITSEQEGAVVKNIERKERDAARMASEMVKHMSVYNTEAVHGTARQSDAYAASRAMDLPKWITA